jgi:hypothetical protein
MQRQAIRGESIKMPLQASQLLPEGQLKQGGGLLILSDHGKIKAGTTICGQRNDPRSFGIGKWKRCFRNGQPETDAAIDTKMLGHVWTWFANRGLSDQVGPYQQPNLNKNMLWMVHPARNGRW